MSLTEEIRAVRAPKWYRWWIVFSTILGYFMLRAALTVLYYIVVTPLGLLMKLFGNDAMKKKPSASYWMPRHE